MPHLSFLNSLMGIVVTRSGSKHFRRVTHCRDAIENGQSVLPPRLLANSFEKNLLTNTRDVTKFPDCGHATLHIEAIRGRHSQGNWSMSAATILEHTLNHCSSLRSKGFFVYCAGKDSM